MLRYLYLGRRFGITTTSGFLVIASNPCELQAAKVSFQDKIYGS